MAFFSSSFAEKVAELPEVLKPTRIKVFNNQIYISLDQKDHGVVVYSLKDFQLKMKIARRGEGPGEIKKTPYVFKGEKSILMSSFGKVLWFSQKGEFQFEKKFHPRYFHLKPLGNNIVGAKFRFNEADFTHSIEFNLLNTKGNEIKKLYLAKKDAATAGDNGKFKEFKMLVHYSAVHTYKNKIFIGDSRKGLFFKVFDNTGKHQYTINSNIKKVEVKEKFKIDLIAEYKKSEKEIWPMMKGRMTFYKYYPLIRTCFIEDDKIYITTYLTKGKNHQLIIMDLKGDIINIAYIPIKSWRKIIYSDMHEDLFTIKNNIMYELVDNYKEEVFELHKTDLNKYLRN